ncbi:MAG TPA: GH1 family beta-glucosidase [Amaricoccus sp.]|uniref:GH1 family beta-glucosidase n=1 Tax=Amaricoccus sp. TaxID=1872485 RepID=UPI002BB5323D|nr:GH1 family beta-glucosidase [Amaricoccus sp.]HMQ94390.1 GH1 family beta-glucosidase [Amaricoccus sp.]HMR54348.1 GH1 family beta-glucosidase [Amaricoccus sp.]HMR60902.1 GH1 family beta-glucosidase [Amaricoccus sp.]HMU01326.1 GH1 family beta-glucosidase [Amaricoccus sp.]
MADPAAFAFARSDFPEGFVFGAATAAYQIEGSRFGGAGPCHWDSFAATPGNVVRAEDGATACDHYHRWEADLDLMRDAGLDAYRFSMSWARVMPEGRGAVNREGLDFYDRLVDGMLARGLQPWATLYHWELPSALSDLGGWRNRDIAGWFADYVTLVMRRVGDRIHAAAPVNEPWCVAWLGHFLGLHAPGLRDIRAAARAMHHVLLAHGTAIQAMRALGHGNLGTVLNFEYAAPVDDSAAARQAARLYDAIYNRWFAGGIFAQSYPEAALAGLEPHMPANWRDDFATIGEKLDWVGINYYTRKLIAADPASPWPRLHEVPGPLPKTDMGWEIYPDGLYHFLTWLSRVAAPRLPIYVTENGLAAATPREDVERIAFLDAHVAAARRAMAQGVDLRGYFVWSLLDNYEWAAGYEKRFGLVHVDFDTLERRPKASYHALRAALAG